MSEKPLKGLYQPSQHLMSNMLVVVDAQPNISKVHIIIQRIVSMVLFSTLAGPYVNIKPLKLTQSPFPNPNKSPFHYK